MQKKKPASATAQPTKPKNRSKKRPKADKASRRISQLENTVRQLRASNERLRSELASADLERRQALRDLDYYQGMAVTKRMAALEVENHRLRENARLMHGILSRACDVLAETGALLETSMERNLKK